MFYNFPFSCVYSCFFSCFLGVIQWDYFHSDVLTPSCTKLVSELRFTKTSCWEKFFLDTGFDRFCRKIL